MFYSLARVKWNKFCEARYNLSTVTASVFLESGLLITEDHFPQVAMA